MSSKIYFSQLIFTLSIFYIDIEVLDHKAEGLEEQLSILKNRIEMSNNLAKFSLGKKSLEE